MKHQSDLRVKIISFLWRGTQKVGEGKHPSLLTTAGDLVFAGDLEGNAFALDAKTGEKLWSFNTGGRIVAAPVSFSVRGRQFVTISSGGGANIESYMSQLYPESKGHLRQPTAMLFVFALPEKSK